jgi:hypothetical protein
LSALLHIRNKKSFMKLTTIFWPLYRNTGFKKHKWMYFKAISEIFFHSKNAYCSISENGCIIMQNGCHTTASKSVMTTYIHACMQFLFVSIKFSNTKLNNDFPFCDVDTTNSARLRQLTQHTLQILCLHTRDFYFKTYQHMLMHFWTWHAAPNLVVVMWKTPQFKPLWIQVHLLDRPPANNISKLLCQAWYEQRHQLEWKMSATIQTLDTVIVCIVFQEKDLLTAEFWKINTFPYSVNNKNSRNTNTESTKSFIM